MKSRPCASTVNGLSTSNLTALFVIVLWLTTSDWQTMKVSASSEYDEQTQAFLRKYGYIESTREANDSIRSEVFSHAVSSYQKFFGLKETGELDKDTIQMMESSRCGNSDSRVQLKKKEISAGPKRRKRSKESPPKWKKTQLTYNITNYPKQFKLRVKDVDLQIKKAFNAWSSVTPLNFVEADGSADISIKFATKAHCSSGDFDGPSGTIAHTYPPEIGKVHLDAEENWTIDEKTTLDNGKIDLFSVALHQFGHVLGLNHTSNNKSVMFPHYVQTDKLHQIDIEAIQTIYGENKNSSISESPSADTNWRFRLCKDSSLDAVTMAGSDKVFIFKDKYYWRLTDEADGLVDGYPRLISNDWPGLPAKIDAALTYKDKRTYFFRGHKFWRFTYRTPDAGYPRNISEGFKGIPNDIDAAFYWEHNQGVYFLKGDKYWRYDAFERPRVKDHYPLSITKFWKGIPTNLSDAFTWKDGHTYFFKDDKYYKYDNKADRVDTSSEPSYPRSVADMWFGCGSDTSQLLPLDDLTHNLSAQANATMDNLLTISELDNLTNGTLVESANLQSEPPLDAE